MRNEPPKLRRNDYRESRQTLIRGLKFAEMEMGMNPIKVISAALAAALFSGCAATQPSGSKGPNIVSSGQATETGQYVEVGVEFTSWGDFVALVSPKRWESPIATGGSLSWLNPAAWSDDSGRTGRILLGEAVVIGSIAVAAVSGSSSSSDSSPSQASPTPPTEEPPATGGGSPPTLPF